MLRLGGKSTRQREISKLLRTGGSLVALCAVAAATPAFAQDEAPAQDEDEVVVSGIRASLESAQNIKRNSDTVVDAITASDIGALPDRSVTEALQRIPGVSMNRFSGSNDPDHFSVEGSGVVIRGLAFVRSEFNGRDTFSTGVYGQAINFADVPAELLGSVEVYKNLTAELTEGGLSGIVNLNTRLPLNRRGFHVGFDAQASYSDLAKKWSPTGSLFLSNTWETGVGTIGIMGNVSYSQVLSQAHGIQIANFQTRDNTLAIESNSGDGGTRRCRNPLPADTNTQLLPPGRSFCGTPSATGADNFADYAGTRYAPLGGQFRTQDYDRERQGYAAAVQWESLDRRAVLTLQFLRSDSSQKWGEHTFESAPDLSEYNTYPYGCRPNENGPDTITPPGTNPGRTTRAECPVTGTMPFRNYQYDANGVFEKGYITLPGVGWRATDSGGAAPGGWRTPTGGMQQSLSRRMVDDRNIVNDAGLNFKFTPNENWQINLDAQYVKAQHDNVDMSVFGSIMADNEIDLTGDVPIVVPHKPLFLSADWSGCTPAAGMAGGTCSPVARINNASDETYFRDPGNYWWRAAMDHIEHSVGEEVAFKADIAYNFADDSFLKRIKFGARYADRDQNIKFTNYNWGVISETWGGGGPQWMDTGNANANREFYSFNNFFRGQTPGPVGGWYYNGDLIGNYFNSAQFFRSVNATWAGGQGWVPAYQRAGVVAGTSFLPSEIQLVSERTINGYTMLSFGQEDLWGDVGVSGNIGVRYVDTSVVSQGAVSFPGQAAIGVADPFATRCAPRPVPSPPAPAGTPDAPPGGVCNLGETGYNQLRAFANGASTPDIAEHNYRYFLPSLNLKFDITDSLVARLAMSRAIARPGMADIRNYRTFGVNSNDPQRLQGTRGNPFLLPAISDQADVTLEWYFARVGSLTLNGFYKNIKNFFYQQVVRVPLTNNGITRDTDFRQPSNFNGSGKVKGFEIAYQQTFDFLPTPLNGLGFSGNYTFIDSQGLPMNRASLGPGTNLAVGRLPLEQMSKHNVNASLFFEKGPVSLRVAYNWRSKFLLTSADVIHPFSPIYNDATGSIDASAFINITKEVKLGIQAVNLNNEVLKTLQQIDSSGTLMPRSYFMNDRRYSFILRGSF